MLAGLFPYSDQGKAAAAFLLHFSVCDFFILDADVNYISSFSSVYFVFYSIPMTYRALPCDHEPESFLYQQYIDRLSL